MSTVSETTVAEPPLLEALLPEPVAADVILSDADADAVRPDSNLAPPPLIAEPPQCRFWDETVRLLGLFEKNRLTGDSANAAACFGRLAKHRHWEATNKPGYNPDKKSLISVFQPKSGGTYLHNRMLQLGYQEFWWMFPDRLCHSVCYASDEAIEYYLSGGCTCHSHARPDPNILAALDRARVDRIWVHLRNPAESVVSSYHHLLGEGHGRGDVGDQRKHEALANAQRSGLIPGMDKSDFVVEQIGWHIDWVAQWLRFAADHPDLVVFSYYAELDDPQALLARVFGEMGAEISGSITPEANAHDRFREKSSNDWRRDLTPAAQAYLELRVTADLHRFPAFQRLWR